MGDREGRPRVAPTGLRRRPRTLRRDRVVPTSPSYGSRRRFRISSRDIVSAAPGHMPTYGSPATAYSRTMNKSSAPKPPSGRRLLRLAGFDYAEPRSYFVTIVVRDRWCVLGEVVEDDVRPSAAGEMVVRQWWYLADRYAGIEVEPFVVMPNHLHGLVATCRMSSPPALGRIVGAFKSITARVYRAGADCGRWPAMPVGLWQRGYFDRIVRDEADEARVVEYIDANPINWASDPDNPHSPEGAREESRLWSGATFGRTTPPRTK